VEFKTTRLKCSHSQPVCACVSMHQLT